MPPVAEESFGAERGGRKKEGNIDSSRWRMSRGAHLALCHVQRKLGASWGPNLQVYLQVSLEKDSVEGDFGAAQTAGAGGGKPELCVGPGGGFLRSGLVPLS